MKESREQLCSNLREVNFNNPCYVNLTEAGLNYYKQHWAQVRKDAHIKHENSLWVEDKFRTPELEPTPMGTRFQIFELMNIFGPMLSDGLTSPFDSVTFDVTSDLSKHKLKPQTIKIDGLVRLELSNWGKTILTTNGVAKKYITKSEVPYPSWAKMPFREVARFFGSAMYNGSPEIPTRNNSFYLPIK